MFWQSSSLFRVKFQTREGAGNGSWKYVNESRHTCRVVNCMWEELNITNLHDCKRVTKQHKSVYLFTSIIKDKTAKARSLRLAIKRVSLLHINFGGFSLAKLYQQRMSRLHVVMKKIYNFPEKSELPKFIHVLPVKINRPIFSAVSGVEVKNLQRSEQAHFPVSQLCRSILRLWLRMLVLHNVSLLLGYVSKRCDFSLHNNFQQVSLEGQFLEWMLK